MKRLALNVFVDALGWAIAERESVLSDLCPVRQSVRTVLGYSSTCDPTILTGALPREHGHFTFFRYAPERSPFRRWEYRLLAALPDALTSRARVRNRISRWMKPRHGFTGYFSLYAMPFARIAEFEYTERKDLYRPGGILGGQRTIFDRFAEAGVDCAVSDWRAGDAANVEAMDAHLAEGRVRSAYLYLAELDGVMHHSGTRSLATSRALERLEHRLERLMRTARESYDEVVLRVFSDHGMTDVHSTFDVEGTLRGEGLAYGRHYRAALDSTMARFWFERPTDRARVQQALSSAGLPGRWLSDAELTAEGCDFPDRSYGHAIFLADPGALIVPSDMGRRPIAGMHGYHPDHVDSAACLLSNAPVDGVASLTDLHGMMWADATRSAPVAATC